MYSLPRRAAAPKPAPNSTPLTAGMENSWGGHDGFYALEEGRAQSGGEAHSGTFHHAAERIPRGARLHDGGVYAASCFGVQGGHGLCVAARKRVHVRAKGIERVIPLGGDGKDMRPHAHALARKQL